MPENYAVPLHLFHQGTNLMAYDFFGCHEGEKNGEKGHFFRVWAKNAKAVSVVGDFNCWDAGANMLVSGSYLANAPDFPLAVQSLLKHE